eukprot:TRINITY_DN8943_c1_g1_i1.p1 TRINITY_DN8943_c1_g1~~TRINITY_DN8943_c1_g1_i1.p1  ORF type:complete len:309 (-),score=51.02 TRINITY_DN8943_c1_g1_i1:43-927(-)
MAGRTRSKAASSNNPFEWNENTASSNASPGSYQRGLGILSEVITSNISSTGVTGTVKGSGYAPYSVSIDSNANATCSCPDRRGGWCKHVCAVLVSALRGRPGAAIAITTNFGEAATKRRRTSTRTTKKINRYRDDSEEEEEEEESEEEESEEEEYTKPIKSKALPLLTTPTVSGATPYLTPIKAAVPALSPPHSPLPGGVSGVPGVPAASQQQPLQPVWTGLNLPYRTPQLPTRQNQHGGHACGNCGAGAHNGGRCQGCRFTVCATCETAGRGWHHLAVSGPEHVVVSMTVVSV